MKIAVIDYGMGNLFSVMSALRRAEPLAEVTLANTPEAINAADRVILPGQGAIKGCMNALAEQNMLEAIHSAAENKPFFGMCLGPQVMLSHSEENGGVDALGIIEGTALHLSEITKQYNAETHNEAHDETRRLKIPHMGWNQVQHFDHELWNGISQQSWFYFVHSYFMLPSEPETVAASCEYGANICVAIAKENCFGVQFHPEKSAENGLRLLHNFCHWQP